MNSRIHIQDELASLQSNLPHNITQPFLVPDGYFEGLAAAVLARVTNDPLTAGDELQELSPFLAAIPKTMPFAVPSRYFEEMGNEPAGVFEEKESLLLQAVGKAMPYQVPAAYFENVSTDILNQVAPRAKVVPLFAQKWMRIASAAVIGGVLFIAGSQYFGNQQKGNDGPVATTPAQNQVASVTPAIKQEIKKASTEELENFIETVPAADTRPANKTTLALDKTKVKGLLKDVSDEEMESFLSAIPADEELFITD